MNGGNREMAVILIADDEADIRSALDFFLKAEGYEDRKSVV